MGMIDGLCRKIIERFRIHVFVETGTDKAETVAEVSRWFSELDLNFGAITGERVTGARSYQLNSKPISYPVFSTVKSSRYQIHSVDLDQYSYQVVKDHFKSNPNIHFYHNSSEKFLESFLNSPTLVPPQGGRNMEEENSLPAVGRVREGVNYFFFLDAHWGKYWPLRDEIKVIRRLDRYLIVIDDFMVPGKSNPSYPHGVFGFDLYKSQILNWHYIHDLFEGIDVRVFYPKSPNRDGRGWVLIAHGYAIQELDFLRSLELFELDSRDEKHTKKVKATLRTHLDVRNMLKMLVPVTFLRSMHRCYEKIFHTKQKGGVYGRHSS